PPDGWQADLHQQAAEIMASTDARIESLAAEMPTLASIMTFEPGRDVEIDGGNQTSRAADGSMIGSTVPVGALHRLTTPSPLFGGVGPMGTAVQRQLRPTLAGSPVVALPEDFTVPGASAPQPLPAAQFSNPGAGNSGPAPAIPAPMGDN